MKAREIKRRLSGSSGRDEDSKCSHCSAPVIKIKVTVVSSGNVVILKYQYVTFPYGTSYYGLVGEVLDTEPIKLEKWNSVPVHTV